MMPLVTPICKFLALPSILVNVDWHLSPQCYFAISVSSGISVNQLEADFWVYS